MSPESQVSSDAESPPSEVHTRPWCVTRFSSAVPAAGSPTMGEASAGKANARRERAAKRELNMMEGRMGS
jgi:hypothetical protein